jgi:hypothetical protein
VSGGGGGGSSFSTSYKTSPIAIAGHDGVDTSVPNSTLSRLPGKYDDPLLSTLCSTGSSTKLSTGIGGVYNLVNSDSGGDGCVYIEIQLP